MRPPSPVELLDAWERGLSEPPGRRALTLLAAATPDFDKDSATLSVGERDLWLLTLRESTFGSQLASVANCAACGERLEWIVNVADLKVAQPPKLSGNLSLEEDRYRVSFRLPNMMDLAALADCRDAAVARDALLQRCVLAIERDGQEVLAGELTPTLADAVVKQMGAADPQADIRLDLSCPACSHRWQALFDIESFFWSELDAWAKRLLAEVHLLASAYGWHEVDILNLSPLRRQFYLDLVSA